MTQYAEFDPTALYAGEGPYHSRPVTIGAAGAVTERGTLLGHQTIGAVTAAAKAGGNTGTGTCVPDATTPALANAQPGTYKIVFTSATAYNVLDPKGDQIGQGATGTAFATQIKVMVAAGGTPYVAGDGWNVTVAAADRYIPSVATALDGSQVPSAIVAADIDTTGGDATGPCYFDGGFAFEAMTIDASWSVSTLGAAFRANNIPLFVHTAGTLG